jgi:hypothetical protein
MLRAAALLGLVGAAAAAPCDCVGDPVPASKLRKCSAKGDPHYKSLHGDDPPSQGEKFDFSEPHTRNHRPFEPPQPTRPT